MSDIGSRIKVAREAISLSQEALSRAAGVSLSTISKCEQRQHSPSVATIVALARELGVSTDWLLTGEGPHELVVRQGDEDLELRDSEAL